MTKMFKIKEIKNLKNDKEILKEENKDLTRKNNILNNNIAVDAGSDLLLFFFGKKLSNISYAEDNVIINSFVKKGNNYFEELEEINNGKNYSVIFILFLCY